MGLACVAGSLRQADHEVRLLDAAVLPRWAEDLDDALECWRPQVVGITASTAHMAPARDLALRVKEADPPSVVVLGGVHATLFPREVAEVEGIDFAVHGEGELTAVELLAALADSGPVGRIAGIAYRDRGQTRINAPRDPVANLDDLPRPAYDLLPLDQYSTPFSAPDHVISMVTSRGCSYRCAFCDASVVLGRRYRAHSAERVVAEIRHLVTEFGIREVLFKDSEFTLSRTRVERFCDLMVAEGAPVTWTCSARVNCVDGPLLRKMAAAGCRVIQFGVESADPAVLELLNKRVTLDKVREAFRAARAAGIDTVANLMVGSPGETWDSIAATERFVGEIRPDHLNIQALEVYPGTELYETLGGRNPVDAAEARRRRRRLLRSFYLRPGRILERVFTLKPRHWQQNIAAAAEMVGVGRG
jgi:radical SAM superfamily enzyme YgiQ (UPF0313 family)